MNARISCWSGYTVHYVVLLLALYYMTDSTHVWHKEITSSTDCAGISGDVVTRLSWMC